MSIWKPRIRSCDWARPRRMPLSSARMNPTSSPIVRAPDTATTPAPLLS
ncbi:hypothetical protein [Streptomyces scabiei]|nr:hypothetical protein [Streptomyces scabiei]MDX3028262.1 hypothetical protein [Streptomyces scabiei]